MKLLIRHAELQYLDELRRRLEASGIPAFVSNRNHAGIPPIGVPKSSLWIYIDEQYREAVSLIHDPGYRVKEPVDMAYFESLRQSFDTDRSALNDTLIRLGAWFVALMIASFCIYLGLAWLNQS